MRRNLSKQGAVGLAILLGATLIALILVFLVLPAGAAAPAGAPPTMGKPILECADGSWVDNRAAGACFDHGGLDE